MRSDEERALDALLRAGRADPSPDDLRRLERRLSPWLNPAAASTRDGIRGMAFKSILFLAAFGLVMPSETSARAPDTEVRPATAVVAKEEPHEATPTTAPSTESTLSVSDLPNAPVVAAKPAPKTNAARAVVAASTNAPDEAAGTPSQEQAESEASFLRRAQTAMAEDPSRALHMLQEHPSRFPHGVLVQERDVMIIDSLARLGRTEEARAKARAFAAQYPHSAHESRIESIVKEGTP